MAAFKKPVRLKEALAGAFADLGLADEILRWQLVKDFGKIVGEQIAGHAQAYKTAAGVLYIQVDSPTWLSQLHLIKDEFIKKLNDVAGKGVVKDIVFNLKA